MSPQLPSIELTCNGATAEIFPHGGHLSRFVTQSGDELLFLSHQSRFEVGKPIRGGIPVIFPWFGPKKDDLNAPAHGFARVMEWKIQSQSENSLLLVLESDTQTLSQWPHLFHLEGRIQIASEKLQLSLQIHNTGNTLFQFETALHTYLRVSDVRHIQIDGLGGKTFLDKVAGGVRKLQSGAVSVVGEVDRVYLDSSGPITLRDGTRTLTVTNLAGVKSTVVWNPHIEKSRALADLGDDEWPNFVCIESGVIADDAVLLPAGQNYEMSVEIQRQNAEEENAAPF